MTSSSSSSSSSPLSSTFPSPFSSLSSFLLHQMEMDSWNHSKTSALSSPSVPRDSHHPHGHTLPSPSLSSSSSSFSLSSLLPSFLSFSSSSSSSSLSSSSSSSPSSSSPSSVSSPSSSPPSPPPTLSAADSSDLLRCNKYLDYSLNHTHKVQFLLSSLPSVGCPLIVPTSVIRCVPCPPGNHIGSFASSDGVKVGVQLCSNHMKTQKDVDVVLTHELIHLYDHCKYEMEPMNITHRACTEVRAASLSGDCKFVRALSKGEFNGFMDGHRQCVRSIAEKSIISHPECKSPTDAMDAVEKVFEDCYRNNEPFGSIPV